MLTENITTRISVMTIMFFIIYTLIKPVVLGDILEKNKVVKLPLLFFIWLSVSEIMSNVLSSNTINLKIIVNSMFIYLTILYIIAICILLYLSSNYQLILIVSGVYLAFSLISIYL